MLISVVPVPTPVIVRTSLETAPLATEVSEISKLLTLETVFVPSFMTSKMSSPASIFSPV